MEQRGGAGECSVQMRRRRAVKAGDGLSPACQAGTQARGAGRGPEQRVKDARLVLHCSSS